MSQQGLLFITGAIRRFFKRIRFFLGTFANGVRRIFLGVGPVLECFFPGLLSGRVTGHCAEPEEGGTK